MPAPPDYARSVAEALKTLGLTKYEALVYVALLQVTKATATEIHELSGVPRASVYPVLDRLLQKNMVTVSHTTPKRFSATPPEDAINTLMREIEEKAAYAKDVLGELWQDRTSIEGGDQELIWNILGEANITSRLRDLIYQAGREIRIMGSWALLKDLRDALGERAGEVRIEVIANRWEGEVPEGITVTTAMPPVWHEKGKMGDRAGMLFADGTKVMVAMGSQGEAPTALFSEAEGFVRFFSRYWDLIHGFSEKK
ncbi:TrmB family transcriptional regulator [Methanofollis sp. UBA420]|jgi:sugar-specific transcriptional regulator TrmB|uniref:TrmB family transcriptional regulator n=1 Tax=Methanofollis sp. UBA420 TaxID=1915514 RepID=UPI00316AC45B